MINFTEMLNFEINVWVHECSGLGKGDYCTSWHDAEKIIEMGNISVSHNQAWPSQAGPASQYAATDKTTLRAAMICYLKMQEVFHA